MSETWTIELAQFPIRFEGVYVSSHNFWVLKDGTGATIREFHGLGSDADGNALVMGHPLDSTDFLRMREMNSENIDDLQFWDVFHGNFFSDETGVTSNLAFSGSEADVMAKWNNVGPIADIMNALDFGYAPVTVGEWGQFNSNSAARLIGIILGLDPDKPSLTHGFPNIATGWNRDLIGALAEGFIGMINERVDEDGLLSAVDAAYLDDFLRTLYGMEECFLPATPITMSDGSTKRIDQIVAGDSVMSYDKDGELTAGRVKRTMVNTVKYVLDMFGTGVTPGHVYLCGDGKFDGQHVPLIDILRSDGAIIRADGTKVRAATGCELGSPEDALIWAITGTRGPDGIVVNDSAQIRLGTRIITDEGNDISIAEIVKSLGGIVEDGLIKPTADSDGIPFHWQFSGALPSPEDYILKRSDLTLNEIYTAAEWEDVQPKLQAPLAGEAGGSFINVPDSVTPPNVPLSFAGTSLEPSMTRKQRRAYQAKARKSSPRVSN